MSRGSVLWERVLARHPALSADCADFVTRDPVAQNDAGGDGAEEAAELDALFADFDPSFDSGTSELSPVVEQTFADAVDLWLTASHPDLEHALRSLGLPPRVFPHKRPLLVYGSRQCGTAAPVFRRVTVPRNGWPRHIDSADALTAPDAQKILATRRETGSACSVDPACFEGRTVAVEVANSLLAADRWIVLWPVLESLPKRAEEEVGASSGETRQWERVRRVVWCVSRERISPRDLIEWLSRYWEDTPLRVALFCTALLVRNEPDRSAQSTVLPKVRRALDRFDGIEGCPWILAGP